jgi:NAD+ kinase
MRAKIRRLTVVLNHGKHEAARVRNEIRAVCRELGVDVHWIRALSGSPASKRVQHDLKSDRSDMILVCGGDGTLLQTARRARGSNKPLLGVNIGSLGFLTAMRREEVAENLPRVLKGDYGVSERMAVKASVVRNRKVIATTWALNEVVITRGGHAQMIRLIMKVNGELLSRYLCDGLIIASPTGSTAYCLSAGGPILSPEAKAFAVVPICAHALSNRPIVASCGERIVLEVPTPSPDLILQADGMTQLHLQAGDRIRISAAAGLTRIAHLKEKGFYSILREKLKWSGSNV